ncbi:MAG TPA: hypothetical protein VIZ28_07120 [Chitinophagaceae bacterium]
MKSNGRPRMRSVQLKNGFYIEVCNKGVKKGVKIWSESRKAMEDSASQYANYKEVIILGEYKNGVPLAEIAVS